LDDVHVQQRLQAFSPDNPTINQTANNLAYVIYTSGSTGRPKGVMVEHQALVNRIDWMQNEYQLSATDRVLQKTPFSFDVSVWEFTWPFIVGAPLVMAKPDGHKDPAYLAALIQQQQITTLHFVPSMLRQMVGEKSWVDCTSIKQLFCSGEALPDEVVKLHYQANSAPLHNLYGPTEAAIDVSYYSCPKDDSLGRVPIGKPIQNIQLYILNQQNQLQPKGVVGELHIGGVGLARGYLNLDALTAERFINNPFAINAGDRLYKTGDLARYLTDGNIEYVGRIDDQVKISGLRIELGEIEHQLSALDGIKSAVVVAREDQPGHKQLVAYIIIDAHAEILTLDSRQRVNTLQKQLRVTLPEQLIPVFFVEMADFPLTHNGKTDKKALPAPDTSAMLGEQVALQGETEQKLGQIWASLLNIDIDKLGSNANFFAIGGDSILSIQVVSRAAQLGINFTVKQLFEYQTIQSLVAHADQNVKIKAPQKAATGEIEMLPIGHDFFEDETDVHYFNQSVVLTTPAGFDLLNLRAITEQLYLRHDALRLRFTFVEKSGGDNWTAHHQAQDDLMIEQTIEHVVLAGADFSGMTHIAQDMQMSLSLSDGPLFRAVYFSNADETSDQGRLLLIIHHLMVDGVSWRILIEDIERLLTIQLTSNKPLSLPAKTSSYQQWGEFIAQYATSETLAAERDYWVDVVNEAVSPLPEDGSHTATENGLETIDIILDKPTTSALLQRSALAYRTQINELLLAALLTGFHRWSGNQAIRIDLEGHGREALS
ncbi:MAG: amino acid adenylation domain-containing protein, partial [Psychrosphaera sp.]|nr:amino acid adenylation domain-containing protein [Psychrosphaera sp.]